MAAPGSGGSEGPLMRALPPATDYMTYLTIVEYNLTKEQLPLLHDILQDINLTINIGWDLVQLLLPMLPESEQCLLDVARLGNPREVVLKVTEQLNRLGIYKDDEGDAEDINSENDSRASSTEPVPTQGDTTPSPHEKTKAAKFQLLVQMLCILHPRIKTKAPSRFLDTSIRALLQAYGPLKHLSEATIALLGFVKTICESIRPPLPPRMNASSVGLRDEPSIAPDPEAQSIDPKDHDIQKRILNAFLTLVAERCVVGFRHIGDVPGLAMTGRFMEKRFPSKNIPNQVLLTQLFATDDECRQRERIMSEIFELLEKNSRTLWDDLLSAVVLHNHDSTDEEDVDDPLALSPIGSTYILAAKAADHLLTGISLPFSMSLSAAHAMTVNDYTGGGDGTLALVDADLILGWAAFESNRDYTEDRDLFFRYLHKLSFLSSACPSPSLRFQAHTLTTTILHAHPDPQIRFDYVRDTLEHCPYDNIKVSAVGWLKDEILAAPTASSEGEEPSGKADSNPFTGPLCLSVLAPFLFASPPAEAEELVPTLLPFWLAVLNLLYMLCSSQVLRSRIEVARVASEERIRERFLAELDNVSEALKANIDAQRDMMLLQEATDRASAALTEAEKVSK